jgi:hypothetical protein
VDEGVSEFEGGDVWSEARKEEAVAMGLLIARSSGRTDLADHLLVVQGMDNGKYRMSRKATKSE